MPVPAAKGKRKGVKEQRAPRASASRTKLFVFGFVLLLSSALMLGRTFHSAKRNSASLAACQPSNQPKTLQELLRLSPPELQRCDIALMNLLSATGLRGAEDLDVQKCLKTLDSWAEEVKWETQRHEYRFNEHKEDFQDSYGRFRMMMLGTVLAQDLGIRYTPGLVAPQLSGQTPTLGWSGDSRNFFIHGLLGEKHEGTCASMPLLYVAIGRRLGYPVNLASTAYHLFVRYEEPNGGHFNVEATMTEGFLTPPDEDYKTGKFPCTDEEIRNYGWLRPMSNGQALSQFLDNRGACLALMRRYSQAREAYLASARYLSDTPPMKEHIAYYLHALDLAPLGDRIDDLMSEVRSLTVPSGPRFAYLENRRGQVRYFLNNNTNWASMERAVKDLKTELAEYQKELASGNSTGETGQHLLELSLPSGKRLLLPAEGLPPPLNRDVPPQDYADCIRNLYLENDQLIGDALWAHYKATTPDWMGQAAQLTLQPLAQGKP